MQFDEVRAIWDAQSQQRLFAVDSQALLKSVRVRSKKLRWAVTFEEFAIVLTCFFFPWLNGFYTGEYVHETIGAVIFAGVGAFALGHRIRRIRRERTFDDSILGEIERAIYRVDCQIWRARYFAWWFLLPAGVHAVISMTQNFTVGGFAAALIGYPLIVFVVRRSIRVGYAPERRSLVMLREELLQPVG